MSTQSIIENKKLIHALLKTCISLKDRYESRRFEYQIQIQKEQLLLSRITELLIDEEFTNYCMALEDSLKIITNNWNFNLDELCEGINISEEEKEKIHFFIVAIAKISDECTSTVIIRRTRKKI